MLSSLLRVGFRVMESVIGILTEVLIERMMTNER